MKNYNVGVVAAKSFDNLNEETRSIIEHVKSTFGSVVLIDPHSLCYEFKRDEGSPRIWLDGKDIADLDFLFVRGTRNKEIAISILVHSLHISGCLINDPISRFKIGFASKLLTTVSRHRRGVGSSSFFAFNHNSCIRLFKVLVDDIGFPLVAKPIAGSKGIGVEKLSNVDELQNYVSNFNQKKDNDDTPIFIQKFVDFKSEYRVFLVDKSVIGMARKIRDKNKIAANAAQGGIFISDYSIEVERFVLNMNPKFGIYGLDVALDYEGNIHLIEENFAPLWTSFNEATGSDAAEYQVQRAMERLTLKTDDYQMKSEYDG